MSVLRKIPFIKMPIKEEKYGFDPQQTLEVVGGDPKNPAPTVILIHGGAWVAGDKSEMARDAQRLAKQGFTIINMNYRLASTDPRGNPTEVGRARWPTQREDVRGVVRWARAHAKAFGIDPTKICAMGDSAGGNLAMILGFDHAPDQADRVKLNENQSERVNCVISRFGPGDLTHPDFVHKLSEPPHLYPLEPRDKWLKRRIDASPLSHVKEKQDAVPTLVISALGDTIVPHRTNVDLVKGLKGKDVDARLFSVEGDHMFVGTPYSDIQRAHQAVLDFLNENLRPELAPPSTGKPAMRPAAAPQ
jgi:acetyl esterase/lipase